MRLCSQAGWGMESSVVYPLALIIFLTSYQRRTLELSRY